MLPGSGGDHETLKDLERSSGIPGYFDPVFDRVALGIVRGPANDDVSLHLFPAGGIGKVHHGCRILNGKRYGHIQLIGIAGEPVVVHHPEREHIQTRFQWNEGGGRWAAGIIKWNGMGSTDPRIIRDETIGIVTPGTIEDHDAVHHDSEILASICNGSQRNCLDRNVHMVLPGPGSIVIPDTQGPGIYPHRIGLKGRSGAVRVLQRDPGM